MRSYELIQHGEDWELILYQDGIPVSGAGAPGDDGRLELQSMADDFMFGLRKHKDK